ncbi:MAG: hypothetical protein JNL58_32055 [Planctomyces sp.]|nr:hypothetical protein [Planctomyces sp.]
MFDEFHYGAHGQFGAIFSYQNRPHAVDFPVADGSVPELIFIEVQIQIEGLDEGDEEVCQSAPWAGTESGIRIVPKESLPKRLVSIRVGY